jgi:antitoxin component of MazEF toxin-antitoxin module
VNSGTSTFPSALAQAMEFERGEMVEWSIEDRNKLILRRREQLFDHEKKKPQTDL